jgi:sugar phosphate isomerase/epimerase
MGLKLGISSLAWDNDIDYKNLFSVLKDNNIKFIEIVLPKFIDWKVNDTSKLSDFVNNVLFNGLYIKSTQSLYYGTGINSYHSLDFIKHLEHVMNICKNIGVTHLVLGAPTMRTQDKVGLSKIFSYIDSVLKENDQILLLEPNSKIYNGNYFFTVNEINNFIKTNNFNNIKNMIDTHNVLLEKENPTDIILNKKYDIKHIHISEQNLSGFTSSKHHDLFSQTLKENKYDGLIIYEAQSSPNLINDIKIFSKTYNI